jgi:uncharacterized protein
MRFWDSSALAPLLLHESESVAMRQLMSSGPDLVVWALSATELTSALWRRSRSKELSDAATTTALRMLADLEASWHAITDLHLVSARAKRLLATHPLRAADACQLAAALIACRDKPDTLAFVTLDERLGAAAQREGFDVLPDPTPG